MRYGTVQYSTGRRNIILNRQLSILSFTPRSVLAVAKPFLAAVSKSRNAVRGLMLRSLTLLKKLVFIRGARGAEFCSQKSGGQTAYTK